MSDDAVSQIREVQKIMSRAEKSPSYYGDASNPTENIGPWDRAEQAIVTLSKNPEAERLLADQGITFKDGWLYKPSPDYDGSLVSIRSGELNKITANMSLPREVTVQGKYGRPDFKLTADVIEMPGLRPESRFMAVVKQGEDVMFEPGNRMSTYPTREEAWKMAPVLLRDQIDDNGYKVIPTPDPQVRNDTAQSVTRQPQPYKESLWSKVADRVEVAYDKFVRVMSAPSQESKEAWKAPLIIPPDVVADKRGTQLSTTGREAASIYWSRMADAGERARPQQADPAQTQSSEMHR